MNIKALILKIYWLISSQFGFDPRLFMRTVRGVPRFFYDLQKFKSKYTGALSLMPCFNDRYKEAGITKSEYFWQDLLVARWIFASKPHRHIDIGSRLDGFVAHVASFRDIEVIDIRPISTEIPGIVFRTADMMAKNSMLFNDMHYKCCDSLSCLHAIEHFGLGRYGDPIDPKGHECGIANMLLLLKSGGTFYLSTPIGKERVEFNANHVFDPRYIIQLIESHEMVLDKLTVIDKDNNVNDIQVNVEALRILSGETYNLGIFIFKKI